MDRTIDGLEAAIRILFGTADSLGDWACTLDDDRLLGRVDGGDNTGLALVGAGDDLYLVTFFDVSLAHLNDFGWRFVRRGAAS